MQLNLAQTDSKKKTSIVIAIERRFPSIYKLRLLLVTFGLWFVTVVEVATTSIIIANK